MVQIKVGHLDVRVFNAYGPQEDEFSASFKFWLSLEKEIMKAKQQNCCILLEMDANAKIETEFQKLSENGKLLMDLCGRQDLKILNNSPLCQGVITRHRITKHKEEKSTLDYVVVCDVLANYVTNMLIDEKRMFTLTKFVSTRGMVKKIESDHNILYCSFDISYKKETRQFSRKEVFNLKSSECQKLFNEETENTSKFTDIFNSEDPFERKASNFQRCLNQSIRKCFKKVRVNKKVKNTELGEQLEEWTKLKIFMDKSRCEKSIEKARKRFNHLDNIIQKGCSERNAKIVEDYVASLSDNGHFSQTGMWKLRKKLHPQQLDPPMAKIDKSGNVITAPPLLRNLYLETYKDRLRHREIKPEFLDIYEMKTTLWKWRLDYMKNEKSNNWKIEDLTKVLKNLKKNKSRDPQGYINEIFKLNVSGSNLTEGLLLLANGVKSELEFPSFMQFANVTSIYKSKGSRNFCDKCSEEDH